jgi:hypothetical protein
MHHWPAFRRMNLPFETQGSSNTVEQRNFNTLIDLFFDWMVEKVYFFKHLSEDPVFGSVGDLDPVEVANQTFFRVETEFWSRPKKNIRSRTKYGCDRVEIFWVATRMSVATRSKILDCFHQTVYLGKFSEKFLGRDLKSFLGRDR